MLCLEFLNLFVLQLIVSSPTKSLNLRSWNISIRFASKSIRLGENCLQDERIDGGDSTSYVSNAKKKFFFLMEI